MKIWTREELTNLKPEDFQKLNVTEQQEVMTQGKQFLVNDQLKAQ